MTPEHIKPVWYFTPYYAMLRAVPHKLLGVLTMGAATLILFGLPWFDRSPVKSIRYRPLLHKLMISAFCIAFVLLGYLGMQSGALQTDGGGLTAFYFAVFILMPIWSRWARSRRDAGEHADEATSLLRAGLLA